MTQRQLHFGAILTGVGTSQQEWLNPEIPGNASIDRAWRVVSREVSCGQPTD
ncbi:hypothetical protein K5Q02_15575 [Pseudomonas sp. MM211]|uniref:hypothetical protein n=1 Tax=Pseudomonas sp. MM211 TaxID=2866808 RepID=UPI001CECF4FC|nr:hypothetical protein [Pseudomonas sp. MM211]UCJ19259.1 hypothetical protein K5Q02_15575 [Pseudomonas sp. MM211]